MTCTAGAIGQDNGCERGFPEIANDGLLWCCKCRGAWIYHQRRVTGYINVSDL
jgi:hypothetical protein